MVMLDGIGKDLCFTSSASSLLKLPLYNLYVCHNVSILGQSYRIIFNFQLFFVLLHVIDELIYNKKKFKMTDKELVQLCKLGESESLPKRTNLLPKRPTKS